MKITIPAAVVMIGVLHEALSQRHIARLKVETSPLMLLLLTTDKNLPDNLCEDPICPDNASVCRVVRHWCSKDISALCMPCVPQGFDAVCNYQHYRRAVLIKGWQLEPLYCDIQDGPNKVKCPQGSVCIEDKTNPEIGVCCYDLAPDWMKFTVSWKSNRDKKCPPREKNCPSGKPPQKYVSKWGQLEKSCEKAKPKMCPRLKAGSTSRQCPWGSGRRNACIDDQICPVGWKCCPTLCSGRMCQKAVDDDGGPPSILIRVRVSPKNG